MSPPDATGRRPAEPGRSIRADVEIEGVWIRAGTVSLEGELARPPRVRGLVMFAHGSGSSRHSPRNSQVAAVLHGAGFATLLFDLLTTTEEEIDQQTAQLRFDITLLAERLGAATDGLTQRPELAGVPLGYFGASTGAAAALVAAAARPRRIAAIVSRGGRPDLAGATLARVMALRTRSAPRPSRPWRTRAARWRQAARLAAWPAAATAAVTAQRIATPRRGLTPGTRFRSRCP